MSYFLILIFTLIVSSFSFKCGHDNLKVPKLKKLNESSNTRNLDSNYSKHNILIYIHYGALKKQLSQGIITENYYNNLSFSLNSTINYFSKLLSVFSNKQIYLSQTIFEGENDENYITENDVKDILGEIIVSDLILIPKIYGREGIDAAAYPIALSKYDDRPVCGGILLGTHYDFNETNSQSFLIMLLLHEITHVLGFSEYLYDYFQTNSTLIKTKEINGIQRILFTGENVIKQAKRHFNCDNIEGIELENQGGDGSAGSHWEARIMLGDYMISTDYPEIVISEISLALLEDSGWYYVNYYTGGLFRYGKGLGCDFLNNKCVYSDSSNYITPFEREFCVNTIDDRCSAGNIDRGECYIRNYASGIYSQYQYFNNTKIGGFEPADYCPVTLSYPSQNYYFYSRCDSNGKNIYNLSPEYGETYGPNSICVLSSLKLKSSSSDSYKTARCHEVISCDTNTKSFILDIGEVNLNCSGNYEEIEVEGYSGSIICPDYNRVCTGITKTKIIDFCNDPLDCINKYILYDEADITAVNPIEGKKNYKDKGRFIYLSYSFLFFIVGFVLF